MAVTTNLQLQLPANGSDVDTWDIPVNGNSNIIDAALGNVTTLNVVSASGTIALSLSQYQPRIIVLSGLLTAAVNYQFPAGVGGTWAAYNNTTGAFTATLSSAGAGTSVILQQGFSTIVFSDGTNIRVASNTASGSVTSVAVSGGTTGLTTSGGPITSSGTITLAGTLAVASGGTGASSQAGAQSALNVPSASGGGASGTWGINISGNAGSVSVANGLNPSNNYQIASLGVGTSAPGAGAINAIGNITAFFSDDRMKTKLGNIPDALAKVLSLDGFYYEPNDLAQKMGYQPIRDVGVSAQSVQAVMPEVVAPAPIDKDYLTVRYDRLVPLLIEAIKELDAKVYALRNPL